MPRASFSFYRKVLDAWIESILMQAQATAYNI